MGRTSSTRLASSLVVWLSLAGCGADAEDAGDSESSAVETGANRSDAGGQDESSSKRGGDPSADGDGEQESRPDQGGPDEGEPRQGDEVEEAPERATEFNAGDDPDRNKVTAADLCTRIAEINCAGEAYCCDNPGRTVDACKQDLIKTCASDLMLDRVAMQERTRFDAEAAERAYEELERRASMCDPTVAQWGAAPDGLRGLLKGTVPPGESCKPTETVPDPVTLAAALLACEQPETHACTYANPLDAWTCQPRSEADGSCVTDNNCQDGLYCLITAPGLPGMCTARKAVGEACDSPPQCASLFCKRGSCVEADQQAAYCLVN